MPAGNPGGANRGKCPAQRPLAASLPLVARSLLCHACSVLPPSALRLPAGRLVSCAGFLAEPRAQGHEKIRTREAMAMHCSACCPRELPRRAARARALRPPGQVPPVRGHGQHGVAHGEQQHGRADPGRPCRRAREAVEGPEKRLKDPRSDGRTREAVHGGVQVGRAPFASRGAGGGRRGSGRRGARGRGAGPLRCRSMRGLGSRRGSGSSQGSGSSVLPLPPERLAGAEGPEKRRGSGSPVLPPARAGPQSCESSEITSETMKRTV